MTPSFSINHQEYGLPAKISFDFDRREGVVMTSHIEISATPSTEIHFWMDSNKHHHGQITSSLSGGVSPQSRQREVLSQQVANDLYERYITLQKRAAHAPAATISSILGTIATPDNDTEEFLASIPSARREHSQSLLLSCKDAIMIYCLLIEAMAKGCDLPSKCELMGGLRILRKKVLIAARYLSNSGNPEGVTVKILALRQMRKECLESITVDQE